MLIGGEHIMLKSWLNKIGLRQKICILILAFGLITTAFGFFAGDNFAGQFLTNLGCGVLSGSILALIIFPDDKRTEEWYRSVYGKWGLRRIHVNRGRIFYYEDSNKATLPDERLDYIAFGLVGFRKSSQEDELEKKLISGLKIRIIAMHPDSQFLVAHNKFEQHTNADDIRELITWASEMNKKVSIVNKIKIKLYDAVPLDFYCRSDDKVFVGPYCASTPSGQVVTYEYVYASDGGKLYSDFFEKLWNNRYAKISMFEERKKIYKGDQKTAIESIMTHFCDLAGTTTQNSKVIGVVAIYSQDKTQRKTFYSCNKSNTANKHSIRSYNYGVVGIMNKVNINGQCEYAVFYDYTTDRCYMYNLERQRLTAYKGEESREKDTAAILAVPLMVNDRNIGVFSFDFTEQPAFLSNMKYKDNANDLPDEVKRELKNLFENAIECAFILKELVVSYINTDFESQLEKW